MRLVPFSVDFFFDVFFFNNQHLDTALFGISRLIPYCIG